MLTTLIKEMKAINKCKGENLEDRCSLQYQLIWVDITVEMRHGVAKEILLSKYVIAFCNEEKQTSQYLFPINQATKRAAAITDRSELLIKKIRREGVCAGDEKLESPGTNRPRELIILVDDMNRCILKRKIQEFYTVQKEVPTLKKLLKVAREAIISKVGEKRYGKRLRWAGHVARMGESRNAYRVLVGRPEGKRPFGRPRHRWEDNIKMDLREVGYDDRNWINLAQDRDRWRAYVRAAMNLRTVLVSVMDSKVAALMAVLRAHWLAPVLTMVMVVVHTELALFTVQIGKSSAASSVANTHGQKETKLLQTITKNSKEPTLEIQQASHPRSHQSALLPASEHRDYPSAQPPWNPTQKHATSEPGFTL
ncbi:hypothetical protein ANN_14996 [Periplaneta americana]|uniref:Uncharacterized protein n=1 Tax=Periplaneta americana TaxID=6978 RepID=A0ABQ8SZC2_PERAM|nr:hypothetical protein ANN_14996 [Periplaneta americana]